MYFNKSPNSNDYATVSGLYCSLYKSLLNVGRIIGVFAIFKNFKFKLTYYILE